MIRSFATAALAVGVTLFATSDLAAASRSRAVAREFQREHPCPATGLATGACPGWVRDHIQPLSCGGHDIVTNLQRQKVAEAKAKDRWERQGCERQHG